MCLHEDEDGNVCSDLCWPHHTVPLLPVETNSVVMRSYCILSVGCGARVDSSSHECILKEHGVILNTVACWCCLGRQGSNGGDPKVAIA